MEGDDGSLPAPDAGPIKVTLRRASFDSYWEIVPAQSTGPAPTEQTPSFTTTTTKSVFKCRVCTTRNFKNADLRFRHESNVHGCLVEVDEQGKKMITFKIDDIHNCPKCSVPFRYAFVAKQHAFKCNQSLQKL